MVNQKLYQEIRDELLKDGHIEPNKMNEFEQLLVYRNRLEKRLAQLEFELPDAKFHKERLDKRIAEYKGDDWEMEFIQRILGED